MAEPNPTTSLQGQGGRSGEQDGKTHSGPLEKWCNKQPWTTISKHMKDKLILSSLHGFMTGKSHHTKLRTFINMNTDETKGADIAHLICTRAFDTVSHTTLMQTDEIQGRKKDS